MSISTYGFLESYINLFWTEMVQDTDAEKRQEEHKHYAVNIREQQLKKRIETLIKSGVFKTADIETYVYQFLNSFNPQQMALLAKIQSEQSSITYGWNNVIAEHKPVTFSAMVFKPQSARALDWTLIHLSRLPTLKDLFRNHQTEIHQRWISHFGIAPEQLPYQQCLWCGSEKDIINGQNFMEREKNAHYCGGLKGVHGKAWDRWYKKWNSALYDTRTKYPEPNEQQEALGKRLITFARDLYDYHTRHQDRDLIYTEPAPMPHPQDNGILQLIASLRS